VDAVEPYATCTILVERREWPEYRCSADQSQFGGTDCQRVRALALDRQVEERFLEALRPDHLTLARAALAQLEQEEQAESQQWELRLERARDLAKRAERKSQAVEPENRLVARWSSSGKSSSGPWKPWRKRTRSGNPAALGPSRRQTARPWWPWAAISRPTGRAPTTTSTERKQMLRLVIREVIGVSSRVGGQVWVQINWQTGAQEQFWYQRRVSSYALFAGAQAPQQRVRELGAAGLMDAETRSNPHCGGISDPWAHSSHDEQNGLALA
jgi:hypothetical protein